MAGANEDATRQLILDARTALGAPARAAEWQPIETAPKGQRVLVTLKTRHLEAIGEIVWGYFTNETDIPGGIWTHDDTGERIEPVFWFDVPLPPCALTGHSK